jgi:hypothetical protein
VAGGPPLLWALGLAAVDAGAHAWRGARLDECGRPGTRRERRRPARGVRADATPRAGPAPAARRARGSARRRGDAHGSWDSSSASRSASTCRSSWRALGGWGAARSGAWLAILPGAALLCATGRGRLADRMGARPLTVTGMLLTAVGLAVLARLDVGLAPMTLAGGMVLNRRRPGALRRPELERPPLARAPGATGPGLRAPGHVPEPGDHLGRGLDGCGRRDALPIPGRAPWHSGPPTRSPPRRSGSPPNRRSRASRGSLCWPRASHGGTGSPSRPPAPGKALRPPLVSRRSWCAYP